jgi:hypothetical protein
MNLTCPMFHSILMNLRNLKNLRFHLYLKTLMNH